VMRCIIKAFRRPPTGRMGDRNGGLPRLSDSVVYGFRYTASLRRTLLAENLGKPSLRIIIIVPWYWSSCTRIGPMALCARFPTPP